MKLPEETSVAAFRFSVSAPKVKSLWWRGAERKLSQDQKLFVKENPKNKVLNLWFGSVRPESQGETLLRLLCVNLMWSPGFSSGPVSSPRPEPCRSGWLNSKLTGIGSYVSVWDQTNLDSDPTSGEALDELQFEPRVQWKSLVFKEPSFFYSFKLRRYDVSSEELLLEGNRILQQKISGGENLKNDDVCLRLHLRNTELSTAWEEIKIRSSGLNDWNYKHQHKPESCGIVTFIRGKPEDLFRCNKEK